jgi:hypothetical protein
MPYTDGAKNLMLDALVAVVDLMSLHDDAPGSTGTNEISGGAPAYARQGCAFDPASGGSAALSAAVTFDVPASTTVQYIGLWTTAGSVFRGYYQVADEAYASQGTYEVGSGSMDLNAVASA